MGKKRKFNRFIKWIKSDLPEEKTSVLLLGVTKLSSPTLQRRTSSNSQNLPNRPHTLHLETLQFPPFTPSFREKQLQHFDPNLHIHDSNLLQLNINDTIPKNASFCATKENTPPVLEQKSYSFSGKSSKKRVSFSDSTDTDELIQARDIALRNRDLNISVRDHNDNYSRPPTNRRNSVVKFDYSGILDEISTELHIRPISRRSSDVEASTSDHDSRVLLERLYKRFEKFEEEEEFNVDNRIDRYKFKTSDKYHSENDLLDRSPKIQPRKLSAPITSIQVDDVNIFINEIIEELKIGPTFNRSRSHSKSDTLPPSLSIPIFSSSSDENDRNTSVSLTLNSDSFPKSTSSESAPVPTPSILSSDSDVMIKHLDEADGIMDRSVDSIGSCSLDVDLSTDFSVSSKGSVSDCTLRSVSIITPNGVPAQSSVDCQKLLEAPCQTNTIEPTIQITDTEISSKKPSYLNLACCVNGYGNLTTYDSKLRENYRSGTPRSREVSPNRPSSAIDCNVSSLQMTKGDLYLTPESAKFRTKSPAKMESETIIKNGSMNGSSTMTSKQSFFSTTSYSETRYSSVSSKYSDVTDGCISRISPSRTESYHRISNGSSVRECSSEISFSESRIKIASPKSFIQQRVERLYGPGALAQGFFIQTKQSPRKSELEVRSPIKQNDSTEEIPLSPSTPSLPVLRHLRPEFRAQLPILSPKRTPENGIQKSTTIPTLTDVTPKRNRSAGDLKLRNIESEDLMELKKSHAISDLMNEDAVKSINNTSISQDDVTEFLPAAATVILPIVSNGNLNGIAEGEEVKDGHHFLKVLKSQSERIIKLAEKAELELDTHLAELPEEALGFLRSASGKARLLVNQKIQQFEGLCHKNINQIAGEPFPTTAEDLQGFWDMVMLQVNQIDDMFEHLDKLRANNWIETNPQKLPAETKQRGKLVPKRQVPAPVTANSELQRTKREAQRKLMLEQRRKAMLAKKNNNSTDVEIFIPETS